MVRTSQQQKTLAEVEELCEFTEMDEENNLFAQEILSEELFPSMGNALFEDDSETGDLIDILFNKADEAREVADILNTLRYHNPRWKMPFKMSFSLKYLLRNQEFEFRQSMRTTHAGFHAILNIISPHPIFISTSFNPQPPVIIQLALALERLGSNGNGCAVCRMGRDYKRPMGAIVECTRRLIHAIIETSKDYIQWPGQGRREEISAVMALKGFPGCVGFVDGTNIPLYQRPGMDGETFFDQKKRYSINFQVVCDCDRRIIAFYTGWPGSCHDYKCFSKMTLCTDPDEWFSEGEFLISNDWKLDGMSDGSFLIRRVLIGRLCLQDK